MVGKKALETMHPLVFAFIRESVGGPLLVLLGWLLESMLEHQIQVGLSFCGLLLCFLI